MAVMIPKWAAAALPYRKYDETTPVASAENCKGWPTTLLHRISRMDISMSFMMVNEVTLWQRAVRLR